MLFWFFSSLLPLQPIFSLKSPVSAPILHAFCCTRLRSHGIIFQLPSFCQINPTPERIYTAWHFWLGHWRAKSHWRGIAWTCVNTAAASVWQRPSDRPGYRRSFYLLLFLVHRGNFKLLSHLAISPSVTGELASSLTDKANMRLLIFPSINLSLFVFLYPRENASHFLLTRFSYLKPIRKSSRDCLLNNS